MASSEDSISGFPNITGVWQSDDGGTFYIRQVPNIPMPNPDMAREQIIVRGNDVVWGHGYGETPEYDVIFRAVRSGNTIGANPAGEWIGSDFSFFDPSGRGRLTLNVIVEQPSGQLLVEVDRTTTGNFRPTRLFNFRPSIVAEQMQFRSEYKQSNQLARPREPQFEDLSGPWTANDNGNYYVTQINNDVWWIGLSNDGSFVNVYRATRNRNVITGAWADVPEGLSWRYGSLGLEVVRLSDSNHPQLRRVTETGGFGATIWDIPLD